MGEMPKLSNGTPDILAIRLQDFMQQPGAVQWAGGSCPVPDGASYEVLIAGNSPLRITPTMFLQPSGLNWTGKTISAGRLGSTQAPVVAYRVLEVPALERI